jgi:hypothetical protein
MPRRKKPLLTLLLSLVVVGCRLSRGWKLWRNGYAVSNLAGRTNKGNACAGIRYILGESCLVTGGCGRIVGLSGVLCRTGIGADRESQIFKRPFTEGLDYAVLAFVRQRHRNETPTAAIPINS